MSPVVSMDNRFRGEKSGRLDENVPVDSQGRSPEDRASARQCAARREAVEALREAITAIELVRSSPDSSVQALAALAFHHVSCAAHSLLVGLPEVVQLALREAGVRVTAVDHKGDSGADENAYTGIVFVDGVEVDPLRSSDLPGLQDGCLDASHDLVVDEIATAAVPEELLRSHDSPSLGDSDTPSVGANRSEAVPPTPPTGATRVPVRCFLCFTPPAFRVAVATDRDPAWSWTCENHMALFVEQFTTRGPVAVERVMS